MEETIHAIRRELARLKATEMDARRIDEIRVQDRGRGYAQLVGAPVKDPDFHRFGKTTEIHERLKGLPDGSGPEAIRSEFG